jgi:exonuclease I
MAHLIAAYVDVIAKYRSMDGFVFQYKGIKYEILFRPSPKNMFEFDAVFRETKINSLGFEYREKLFTPLLDCDDFEILNAAVKAFDKRVKS